MVFLILNIVIGLGLFILFISVLTGILNLIILISWLFLLAINIQILLDLSSFLLLFWSINKLFLCHEAFLN